MNFVRTSNALRENGGASGLYSHNLHIRVLRLQIFAYTGQGTAGAYASYENIYLAISVSPDFGTCGCSMYGRVGRVGELARNKAARSSLSQLLCFGDSALHALGTIGEYKFSAISLQQVATLHAHGFGHGQDNFVATSCSYTSKADAGVAAGGLNNSSPRL